MSARVFTSSRAAMAYRWSRRQERRARHKKAASVDVSEAPVTPSEPVDAARVHTNGKREIARRLRQIEAGQLRPTA